MKRALVWLICGWLIAMAAGRAAAQAPPAATARYEAYVRDVEARLAGQHRLDTGFVAGLDCVGGLRRRLRGGEVVVEKMSGEELPGAVVHHWRGTAFVPGTTAVEVERVMRGFAGYPRVFAPEVVSARVVGGGGDRVQVAMCVRQVHVITVVVDTDYDVRFGALDERHGWSVSRSTRVAEAGGEDHGFLWRQNTYWSWAERDGGVYLQMESVSLSRAVPRGLGWAVGPFVESVPRESVDFTLRSVEKTLQAKGEGR